MIINIPHDTQVEVLSLSAIMNSVNAANEGLSYLVDEDFFDPDHAKIFRLLKESFNSEAGCSLPAIFAALIPSKESGNFSRRYILDLESQAWSGMCYEDYFGKLKNLSLLRKSVYSAQELILNATQPGADYESVIGEHQNKILQCMGVSSGTLTSGEIFKDFKNQQDFVDYALWKRERFRKGLPTYDGVLSHYPILDATLGSFQNGGIYYIGARTSMGKTTFILNLMKKMLSTTRVGVFSLEMDARMVFEKLVCMFADMKYSKFSQGNFTDEEIERVKSLKEFFSKDQLFIEDEQALTISKLAARAKRMINNHGIQILFVDYLTLIKANGKHPNKHMQVDEVSKGLQSLAKALKIPVVVLAQLNRASIGSEGSRPSLAHFRESGSIEEDADAAILLHRPEYYNKNDSPGLIEVIVAKNRIMGTLRKIEFSCNSYQSECYHELEPVDQALKKARESEFENEFNKIDNRYGKDE